VVYNATPSANGNKGGHAGNSKKCEEKVRIAGGEGRRAITGVVPAVSARLYMAV